MGSDESHFNVSLIVRDKVTKPCPQTTRESRSGIEPRSFRLPAYRLTARPNWLSGKGRHSAFTVSDDLVAECMIYKAFCFVSHFASHVWCNHIDGLACRLSVVSLKHSSLQDKIASTHHSSWVCCLFRALSPYILWAGLAGVRLVNRRTSVRIRFGSSFSSKFVVCGHCLVTLSPLSRN